MLQERNAIDEEIAAITGRPMTSGHLGDWDASRIFDIELEPSAAAASIDGVFRFAPLRGGSVNISGTRSAKVFWMPPTPSGWTSISS
jgi:hypothetical protein